MSEPAEDYGALKRELADLRAAYEELRNARTPAEKEEAREDVAEAKQDLDALAKTLGISRDTLARATADAKKAERKEELRPILQELLDEMAEDEEPEEEEAPEPEPEKPAKVKAEPKLPKPEPDSDPSHPHWSERPISELIR